MIGLREWGISLALGFVSIPWGVIIRLLPTGIFETLFKAIRLVREPSDILPMIKPEREGWRDAITMVRDNLRTFANIRGGRLRSSNFVLKSRQARLPEINLMRMCVNFLLLSFFYIDLVFQFVCLDYGTNADDRGCCGWYAISASGFTI